MPAVLVEDLGKTFVKRRSLRDTVLRPWTKPEKVTALEGISLSVEPGEIFGLLGPNGAGKTTLLKILSCLIIPTTGRAVIHGFDTRTHELSVKGSVGFVTSDERSFYWRLSGRENLHFFARLCNLSPETVRPRCQSLLERLDLAGKADHPFMTYSSGMKQRMAVARALLHDPPILYMDEPTRSLDPLAARHLRELVGAVLNRQEGKTILLATHNMVEAEQLCTRIAILHRSKVRRMGTLPEVRAWARARELYKLEVAGIGGEGLPLEFAGGRLDLDPEAAAPDASDAAVAQGAPRAGESPLRLRAELAPGGEALTRLLSALITRGATIVSCTRQEASLQEIFDMTVGDARPS